MHHEEGRKKSMISALARECSSGGYIVNGPGGRSLHTNKSSTIPGTYQIDPETGEKIPKKTLIPAAISEAVGAATGWGVEDNLIEMLLIIEQQRPLPTTINLCGFSRGADTCLRFANLMDKYYPAIKINIFAVEPVAGPGRREVIEGRNIPSNVQHYVSTLALHQKNPLFEAQDLSRLQAEDVDHTIVETLPFPGTHGKHSKIQEGKEKTHSASELITDLAVQYLQQWGTTFRSEPPYLVDPQDGNPPYYKNREPQSDQQLLNKYAQMIFNKEVYGKPATLTRFFVTRINDYVPILPQCFVNQHHLKLFAKTYPDSYQYMIDPTEINKKKSERELENSPEIKQWLETTFEPIKQKRRLYFDPSKDRLDGNYLRVVMAVHRFQNKEAVLGFGIEESDQLLRDCRRVLVEDHEDKEAMLERVVDAFIKNNPKHGINKLLRARFSAKKKTFRQQVKHEISAVFNRTILQQIIHSLSKTLSGSYRNMYDVIKEQTQYVLDNIDRTDNVIGLLRRSLNQIQEARQKLGINRSFEGEIALEQMMSAAVNYHNLSPAALGKPIVTIEDKKPTNEISRSDISGFSAKIKSLEGFSVKEFTQGSMKAVISADASNNDLELKQDMEGYHITPKEKKANDSLLLDMILAAKAVGGPGCTIKISNGSEQQKMRLEELAQIHGMSTERELKIQASPSG